MQNNDKAMQEALRLAQTSAGQELIRALQQSGGDGLQAAVQQAAAGDFSQAKQMISSLMESPDIQKLLEQLGR